MTDPTNLTTAELSIELDALADVADRHGQLEEARVLFETAARLRALTEWHPAGEVPSGEKVLLRILRVESGREYTVLDYAAMYHSTLAYQILAWRELPEYTEGR